MRHCSCYRLSKVITIEGLRYDWCSRHPLVNPLNSVCINLRRDEYHWCAANVSQPTAGLYSFTSSRKHVHQDDVGLILHSERASSAVACGYATHFITQVGHCAF